MPDGSLRFDVDVYAKLALVVGGDGNVRVFTPPVAVAGVSGGAGRWEWRSARSGGSRPTVGPGVGRLGAG